MNVARDKITVFTGGKDGGKRKPPGGGGGRFDPDDWRADLVVNDKGRNEGSMHNVLLVLEHDAALAKLFFLDLFANRVLLTRDAAWPGAERDEFTDIDGTELAAWFGSPHCYRMPVRRDTVMDCVEAIARRRARHPVREYLNALKWDGQKRIDRLFVDVFGSDDTNYVRRAALCFMVSAVARILWVDKDIRHNGAQVDFMLVIEGDQGIRKTSAVRALFSARWYAESMESPAGKDFYQAMQGRWCIEIGEMDSFSKADVTKVKQAITSRFDTYRPSYGRVARSFRRECVFVGTTNENQYLRDATGGRRFLPVRARSVNIDTIINTRDQLWAEAVALFHEGYKWWDLPPEARDEQDKRFVSDSWEEVIGPWMQGKAGEKHYPPRLQTRAGASPINWATTTELLEWALHIDVGKHTKQDQMRVGPIMRRLGFEHERITFGDARPWVWKRKPEGGGDEPVPF